MASSINTNLSSLFGLHQLNKNQQALRSAFEKVSSGSRINSAKDDAAGLAISNRFQTQIGGLNVAVRNANDGISFAQTAESALSEVSTSLQRVRDLSLQASNGTNSPADRQSIQKEVDQLVSEINRVAETTTFNGKKVLGGVFDRLSFQIGANANESVSVGGFNAKGSALGSQPGVVQSTSDRTQLADVEAGAQGIQEGNATTSDITDFTVSTASTVPGQEVNIADQAFGGAISTVQNTSDLTDRNNANFGSGTAKSIAERINSVRESGEEGFENVYATANTEFRASDVTSADFSGTVDDTKASNVAEASLQNGDLQINGIDIGPVTFQENDSSGSLANAINAKSSETGVSASVDDNGELVLNADDGRDIVVSTSSAEVSNNLFGGGEARFDAGFSDLRVSGQVTVSATETLDFGGTSEAFTGFDDLSVEGAEDNVQAQGTIANADVTTPQAANQTVQSIDDALSQIDNFRASLGAVQNRFESTIRNLSSVSEAQSAANSRIADTDFASQLAELSKGLVKQQAGIALQAQANAMSQQILGLLV